MKIMNNESKKPGKEMEFWSRGVLGTKGGRKRRARSARPTSRRWAKAGSFRTGTMWEKAGQAGLGTKVGKSEGGKRREKAAIFSRIAASFIPPLRSFPGFSHLFPLDFL